MQSIVQKVYYADDTLLKKPHFHDCHQIILILKGEAELQVNGKALTAKGGDIMIFSRYENHSVAIRSAKYERYVLHIDPTVINKSSPVYSLLTDRPEGFCNIVNVSKAMHEAVDAFKRILREHQSLESLAEEMEQLAVKQLLITVCRCTPLDLGTVTDETVTDIKRRFEENCGEPFSLNALAKQYSISASSLSHRFREVTGVSVMGHLMSCRIARAKQLLAETDMDIGLIVEKCGFSDNSNFSRTFKARIGVSPTDFRKRYKGE